MNYQVQRKANMNRLAGFFKKRLQHRCFPVKFVKLSRTVVVASDNT